MTYEVSDLFIHKKTLYYFNYWLYNLIKGLIYWRLKMSAESIRENAIRKVIQELIVPDLGKIMNKQDILEERINFLPIQE